MPSNRGDVLRRPRDEMAYALVAQRIERWFPKPCAAGPIPAKGTCGMTTAFEHDSFPAGPPHRGPALGHGAGW